MSDKTRPNVLVVHTDQHRTECLGAYGNNEIRTPNIDAIASDGVRYDNSFCPYPVCTPSRYSLLCGQYVHEHRGWNNHCTLPPGTPTFPNLLQGAGYRTHAVGKMHFTPTYLDVGFAEMRLCEQDGPGRWDDDYHRDLREAGLVDWNDLEDQRREYRARARQVYWDTFGALPSNLPEEYHATTWTGQRAVDVLRGWKGGGNLLMAGFVKPHHPFDPPGEWAEAYDPDKLTLLPGWTPECFEHDLALHRGYFPHNELTEAALRRVMAYYYATIEHIDQQVGRMLAVLKEKGLYENTLIVVTSDHGEYLGYHHMLLKGNHPYEALASVPLIIKFPSSAMAGESRTGLVCNLDVAPTILRTCGLAPAATMKGLDLARDKDGREHVFLECSLGNQRMVRTASRKLVLSQEPAADLLYDLEADPGERDNLIGDEGRRGEADALRQVLDAWRASEMPTELYLDEDAPVIDQPNVPERGDGHREEMAAYCQQKVKGLRGEVR